MANSNNLFGKDVFFANLRDKALFFFRQNTVFVSKCADKLCRASESRNFRFGNTRERHFLECPSNCRRSILLALDLGIAHTTNRAVIRRVEHDIRCSHHDIIRRTSHLAGQLLLLFGTRSIVVGNRAVFIKRRIKLRNTLAEKTPVQEEERSKPQLGNINGSNA